MKQQPLPKEFYCPITQELMRDPVIGPDGQTYERSAIVDWLSRNGTSPLSREPMDSSQLLPNIALRNTIARMQEAKNPVVPIEPNKPAVAATVPAVQESKEEEKKLVVAATVPRAPAPAAAPKEELKVAQPTGKEELGLVLNAMRLGENKGLLHVSVVPPEKGERKAHMLVCLLDVSGSMSGAASIEDTSESDGFSRLDLVKHSVRTIVHMLDSSDYLAIIAFSDKAKLTLEATKMDAPGQKLASKQLDCLHPNGYTNIWDALRMAIDLATGDPRFMSMQKSILLFTDGEPNVNPPRGIVPTLTAYLTEKGKHVSIHSFGYGYNLDSEMLLDVALLGDGVYCYIPDCTMVGTIFVNYISNCLATAVDCAELELFAGKTHNLTGLGYELRGGKISVGAVQYGQSRDFMATFEIPGDGAFEVKVRLRYEGRATEAVVSSINEKEEMHTLIELSRCKHIVNLVRGLTMAIKGPLKTDFFDQFKTELLALPSHDKELVKAIVRDFESVKESEGQAAKALTKKDWFGKWGKHYIRSLIRAHQLQMCHNFKDPGVQLYGGKQFHDVQARTDALFCDLPAPTPSIKKLPKEATVLMGFPAHSMGTKTKHAMRAKRVADAKNIPAMHQAPRMRGYLDNNSGCFDGEGTVELTNGMAKHVKNLQKGDEIVVGPGMTARVVCLIAMATMGEKEMVILNGLHITPWHPVRQAGVWVFPGEIKKPELCYCEFVYNLVLDRYHVARVNGVELVTLGHGLEESAVVKHEYFGTQKVIEDLKRLAGWETGRVNLQRYEVIRDSATGLVKAIH